MKRNVIVRNINYGKGQVDKVAVERILGGRPYHRRIIPSNYYEGRFLKRRHSIVETTKKVHSKVVSSYTRPWFKPGDKVYVIVYDTKSPYGAKIVKTTILEVSYFGIHKRGYLIDYWIPNYGNGHGIDADCIFKSYNEAKFFLFY